MPTISVVVVPADPHLPIEKRDIDRGYKAGQAIVGGLIEAVDIDSLEATIWVNEEGILLDLAPNMR